MSHLAAAVAGLARVLRKRPDDAADLLPAFLLLAESMAACVESPPPKIDAKIARLVELEIALADREPGERAAAIRQRLKMSKSSYYEHRLKAIEQGLLSQSA